MKTLLVLRHAKSSWDDGDRSDHDRPLNARGKREAAEVGRHLAHVGMVPDAICASTARRARKTAERVVATCGYTAEIATTDALYEANGSQILAVIRQFDDRLARVLIVGHNPGLESAIGLLTGGSVAMSTSSLATIELHIAVWSELAPTGQGRLVAFWRPDETHTMDIEGA